MFSKATRIVESTSCACSAMGKSKNVIRFRQHATRSNGHKTVTITLSILSYRASVKKNNSAYREYTRERVYERGVDSND